MTLYTNTTLGVNWRRALDEPLTTDMATWLRWFDMPVPGTQLEYLGVMARSFIWPVFRRFFICQHGLMS